MKNLNERVMSIQKGEEDINQFIIEFTPFIKSAASKTAGKHIDSHSDELSVAMLAFNEAIENFDTGKGSFLAFSGLVIRRRLIDYMRKKGRESKEIAYTELSESQKIYYDNQTNENDNNQNPLILEINALNETLEKYNIDFEDLVSVSPKAAKTKSDVRNIVKFLIADNELIIKMRNKNQIPIKEICENCNVPRKLVERHRKYIVTVTEILIGDYPFLQDYISYSKEVKK